MNDSTRPTESKRIALVTGASRGIGRAIAIELAAGGHHLLLNYRSQDEAAAEVLANITDAGGSAELLKFDVRSADAVNAALGPFVDGDKTISVLVNNAGITRDGPFPAMDEDAWQDVTRTSLDGFYNLTRPLVMAMVRQRFGRIINLSSVSGLVGTRGQVNYSAAKAGLIGATRALAQEVAKRKVTVNAVAPGLIDTDMITDAPVKEIVAAIPMRRLGRPDEVAKLVSFLASEHAGYITGQVIGINGGLA
ncbi:MAG: 3-oxoacyl-ACP reductase FabG [Polyangiaceae bacterium]|nr:3-oxoacyl-ACP reductase FabG [Polyangiaceae bacterium]